MLERAFERALFACRWLLAPFYAALAIGLVVLLVKLLQELGHFILHAWESNESQTILGVLTLVDLSFTASLLIIVMFSVTRTSSPNSTTRTTRTGRSGWGRSTSRASSSS